jgi:class 3 adenylate cyclase
MRRIDFTFPPLGAALKEAAVDCKRCRCANPADAAFCNECGAPLDATCAFCGESTGAGARFCGSCGQSLWPQSEALTSRFGSPDVYTPQHLVERILTQNACLAGERKHVSVLFADMRGSMELIADRDPEEAQKILDPVVTRMMDAIHRYEGYVCQVSGDGIMALFGAPIAHEDHALRACRAALDLQENVERFAVAFRVQHGIDVRVRVGINSGEVVVRGIRSDLRLEYTAIGPTVHLAARMEQLARPGTILVAQSLARLVEGFVDVKWQGPVPVKGLRDPIAVYELLAARHARSRFQTSTAAHGLSNLVGRSAELEILSQALKRAQSGYGQIVALVGEPGIGKSRLAYELQHSPNAGGCIGLEGSCVSYGRRTAYLPIVSLLKTYLAVNATDGVSDIRKKVEEGVRAWDEDVASIITAILWLFDIPEEHPEASEWAALDPAIRRQRTIDAIKRFVLLLSQVQPVIILFEDLQWIDVESQAFLTRLPPLRAPASRPSMPVIPAKRRSLPLS